MLRRYLGLASLTPILIASGIGMVLNMVAFQALPVVGGDLIDQLPGYTYAEIMDKLEGYGPEGRRIYALASPTLDTLFPILYVTFFAGLIHRLRPTPVALALVPIVLGVWDLFENAQITAMNLTYPDVSESLASSASLFTRVKHVLTSLTLMAVLVAAALAAYHRLRPGK